MKLYTKVSQLVHTVAIVRKFQRGLSRCNILWIALYLGEANPSIIFIHDRDYEFVMNKSPYKVQRILSHLIFKLGLKYVSSSMGFTTNVCNSRSFISCFAKAIASICGTTWLFLKSNSIILEALVDIFITWRSASKYLELMHIHVNMYLFIKSI